MYILYTHRCRYICKAYEKSRFLFNCKLYDEYKDDFYHKNRLQSDHRLLFLAFNNINFVVTKF